MMTYVLIDSSYIKNSHGQKLFFLDTRSGNIISFNDTQPIYPYFYTKRSDNSILYDDEFVEHGFVDIEYDILGGTLELSRSFNEKKVHRVTTEVLTDPFQRKPIELLKVEVKSVFYLKTHPKAGETDETKKDKGMVDLLGESELFNHKMKYSDVYLREAGWVMGMGYELTDEGMKPITPDVYPTHESFSNYDKRMVDWYLPRLFSPIPKIAHLIMAYDIEVDSPINRMPDCFETPYPVSSVVFVSKGREVGYVLADHLRKTEAESYSKYDWANMEKVIFDSEKDLLRASLRMLIDCDEPLISGYNIDLFDLPYLVNRAGIYGVKPHEVYARRGTVVGFDGNPRTTLIKGIEGKTIIDLYSFMSNPSIKNYAFKAAYERNRLEDVSQALLGKGKYKHEKWYCDMSSAELLYYNLLDSRLIIELFEYENEVIPQLMFMLMRVGNLTLPSIARRKISGTLKGMIESSFKVFDYYAPNSSQLLAIGEVESMSTTGKGFKGAITIDPIAKKTQGVHFGVTCVDYNSLYPSIIKNKEVCFTTLNCLHRKCKDNKVPELTHHICRQKRGLYSQVLGFVRDTRIYFIKPQMKVKPEYKIVEQTLKVLINAGYGVVSSPMFDYYCPPMGETVTAWGRSSITSLFNKVEGDGVKLVYSDTDSVFIIASKAYIKRLMRWASKVLGLELGIDYVADIMGLYRSKNYFMLIGNKFNVKGMTGKKKHTPPIIKECFTNTLEVVKMLNENNYDMVRAKIEEVGKKYIDYIRHTPIADLEVERFKMSHGMSRSMGTYTKTSTHVESARIMASELEKRMGRSASHDKLVPAGSTIEHVHVHRESFQPFFKGQKTPNTTTLPLIVAESKMLYRAKYISLLMRTMEQVWTPFGIDESAFSNQSSLSDFF